MSLTLGSAPFGQAPAGEFGSGLQPPAHVMYFERSPRRIRVEVGGEIVADSSRARLLHESGALPAYYLPEEDVRRDLLEASATTQDSPSGGPAQFWTLRVGDRVVPDAVAGYPTPPASAPGLAGYLTFRWDAADAWYEEDEQILGHPPDPYHRVDVRQSSRHVRVLLAGEPVADSQRPRILFETSLPPRYYLPPDDVRSDLLEASDTSTRCAYKGEASYWSVRGPAGLEPDLVWSYQDPGPEAERVRGYVAFFDERVDVEVDGQLQARPQTDWSRQAKVPPPAAD